MTQIVQRVRIILEIFNKTFVLIFIAASFHVPPNVKWAPNGLTVAGGHGQGNAVNQLFNPLGLYVDDDQTVLIADQYNHRIVKWKCNEKTGLVIAGGNGKGSRNDQLNAPSTVIIDKQTDSFIISDLENRRVIKWPCRGDTTGETIIFNVRSYGLVMDNDGFLYVSDEEKHEVRQWKIGESQGTLVAGGNGCGNRLDQLNCPESIFVDRDKSVYVSDGNNHRVMKWVKDAKEGIVVAGGQGEGNSLTQLSNPRGVVIDHLGTIYVADFSNHRIIRWIQEATHGSVVVGGNGQGEQANQLKYPYGLSLDRHGNLYVADTNNHRVQKFLIRVK
jgi:sugar lactone lactonase YvrE